MWGMRLSPLVVALDVDHYGDKRGADTIDTLESELGALPPSIKITARGVEDPGGKYLYRVPDGWTGRDVGKDVELLRHGHRFIAMGTHHKTGNEVVAYDDQTGEPIAWEAVRLGDIPRLPDAWLDRLSKAATILETGSPDDDPGRPPNALGFAQAAPQSIPGRTSSEGYDGGLWGLCQGCAPRRGGRAVDR
jgi:Bifunctional DNA primase/polymerase, N-terminal